MCLINSNHLAIFYCRNKKNVNWTHFDVNKSQQIATAIYLHLDRKLFCCCYCYCHYCCYCCYCCVIKRKRQPIDKLKNKLYLALGTAGPAHQQQRRKKKSQIQMNAKKLKKMCLCARIWWQQTTNVYFILCGTYVSMSLGILFYFVGIAMQSSVSIIKSLRLT